jgi:hypothetical protein
MVVIIECRKLAYNWHEESVGEIKTVVVETFEVGKDGVKEIQENGRDCYRVFFTDGRMTDIRNPNKVEFFPVDIGRGSKKPLVHVCDIV